MLEIKQRRVKTVIVLDLSGTIDIDSANLVERVGTIIQDGYRDIICDLEDVNLVDYSGLSALALAYKNVVNHKGRMAFINVPQHVARTFNLVCLDRVFEIYPDEQTALKKLEAATTLSDIQKKQLRRRFKRLALDIDVKFKPHGGREFLQGKVLNLSAIGLLVFARETCRIGEILDVAISLAPVAPAVEVQAKVVWLVQKDIQPQIYPAMGLEFYHIDCATQEKIMQFVERNMPLDSDVA
ncbi:MAG TPA: anti-sigma factor antagonist [Candidatus Omnitrophota bacterium]|nr:anti-sigma factor antagonist [Candidatus Omnitrophota bacterium]HQJ14996.1 anti-sigma factor antagonist [Candidatus Omnitrophota bacterium]